jgi:hypothetical protein
VVSEIVRCQYKISFQCLGDFVSYSPETDVMIDAPAEYSYYGDGCSVWKVLISRNYILRAEMLSKIEVKPRTICLG